MKLFNHQTVNVALSLLLGSAILFWMYRDFDFQLIKNVVFEEMDWTGCGYPFRLVSWQKLSEVGAGNKR